MKNRIINLFFGFILAILLLLTITVTLLRYYQIFKVPSSSMVPTLYPGDYIVIRKHQIPKRFDVAVFSQPHDTIDFFVKRVVALPGEMVEITNDTLRINSSIVNQNFNHNVYCVVTDSSKLSQFAVDQFNPYGTDRFILNLSTQTLQHIAGYMPEKQMAVYRDHRTANIYPPHKVSGFSTGSYGPIKVPSAGFADSITNKTRPFYRKYLLLHEGLANNRIDKNVAHSDSLITYHCFKNNYYFMMGDNRSESFDSRFFGAIPEKRILGVVKMVLWSVNPESGKLNFKRIFKKIE